jgi:hypothetical protein
MRLKKSSDYNLKCFPDILVKLNLFVIDALTKLARVFAFGKHLKIIKIFVGETLLPHTSKLV